MTGELAALARWWAWLAWHYTRQAWDALPGPWPVKTALIIGCLLIPGPADELALAAIVAACRARKARRAAPDHLHHPA